MDDGLDQLAQSARLAIDNGAAGSYSAAPNPPPIIKPASEHANDLIRAILATGRRSKNVIDTTPDKK